VQCAVAVQKEINARNTELPENRRMQFRIGINLGDVIQEEERIYGDGVNIAARLEGLSEPGGICISKTAFDHIESKLPYGYEFLGDQTVKKIAEPVGAYRVLMEPRVTVAGKLKEEKPVTVRRMPILVGAVAVGIWQFYMRRPSMEAAAVEKNGLPIVRKALYCRAALRESEWRSQTGAYRMTARCFSASSVSPFTNSKANTGHNAKQPEP
jgi:adenylate cyclase